MLKGKKFLVTGSTGRLGREICSRLEELEANVIPVILKGYPESPKRIEWNSNANPIKVYDKEDLNKLEVPDFVINFHWQVDRSKSFADQIVFEINSNISDHSFLWDWLTKVQPTKFVNISTIKIFSEINQNPITSSSTPKPLSPYGIAKFAAENYFRSVFNKSETQVVNIRLGSISSYGEVPTQLLTQLFNSVFNSKNITVNKGHISNILYINEAIDLIISATIANQTGDYLLVGEGKLNEAIAHKFEELAKGKLNAEYIDLFPGVVDPIFISDINKLKHNWTRSYSLDSMIKLIIELNKS